MTLEKLNAKISQALDNAQANNREECLTALHEAQKIIGTLKPQQVRIKTELEALSSIAESLRVLAEKR